jgi:hypothetical protein
MLRPTQSATVFLQQLGRGLRRAPGKAVLTVLDFIGQQRREFRFDTRYRSLTGATRRALVHQVEQGFPFLPSGSQILLDRVAQGIVLANVRQQLRLNRNEFVADVRSYGTADLAEYLDSSGIELADVYRSAGSWTALVRAAGLSVPRAGPGEDGLLRRISAFVHVNDPERAATYARLAGTAGPVPDYAELGEREQRLARMLFFTLWPDLGGFTDYQQGLAYLRRHPAVAEELRQLTALAVDASRLLPAPLPGRLAALPLLSHAHYRREEILAAIDWASPARKAKGHATGVAWSSSLSVEALLVNLHKSEKDFSPTTMYRDFALTANVFHWESQNTDHPGSVAGRRYVGHRDQGVEILLFTRETKTDELGPAPFVCLGPVDHMSHTGERPMAITWRLRRDMPAHVLRSATVTAG